MSQDFSWKKSAKEYVRLYNSIYGLPDEVEEPEAKPELASNEELAAIGIESI